MLGTEAVEEINKVGNENNGQINYLSALQGTMPIGTNPSAVNRGGYTPTMYGAGNTSGNPTPYATNKNNARQPNMSSSNPSIATTSSSAATQVAPTTNSGNQSNANILGATGANVFGSNLNLPTTAVQTALTNAPVAQPSSYSTGSNNIMPAGTNTGSAFNLTVQVDPTAAQNSVKEVLGAVNILTGGLAAPLINMFTGQNAQPTSINLIPVTTSAAGSTLINPVTGQYYVSTPNGIQQVALGTAESVDPETWYPVVKGGLMSPAAVLRTADAAINSFTDALGNFGLFVKGEPTTGQSTVTTLYRAVTQNELDSINSSGELSNLPDVPNKYFSYTPEGASFYAQQAYSRWEEGPFTIIQADFPTEMIDPIMNTTADRGIPSIVVPTNLLPEFSEPKVLNTFTPINPTNIVTGYRPIETTLENTANDTPRYFSFN